MNQNEIVEECSYTLRLWSDATYEVDTSQIKSLLNLVIQRLGFYSQINARYYHFERRWQVRFCWQSEPLGGQQSFEQILDGSQLVCANDIFLERLAREISDRITRIIRSEENQSWVIVKRGEGLLAGIHQAGKTSVNLILRELTQDRNFATNHTTKVTIEAWAGGNAIVRGDSVEVGGMLLQGELLEWRKIGEEIRFRFSPNTHHVNVSGSSADEIRITFATRPRTPRLASFERISRMI
ncbi:hypothetical protein, partial [Nostoc sp.]